MSDLILNPQEIERIRNQLASYRWYRDIFEGFRTRVETLITHGLKIPVAKGMAFYESCPDDLARLAFNPYAPSSHICPKCGQNWQEEAFDLAWVRQFQDWLGKRLVEAGILYRIEGDKRYAKLVRDSLDHFSRTYHDYPLANNLLGPTRLFQSTYLEAFWLVDIVAAYDLTRSSDGYDEADHANVFGLLYESCAVVRSFDEGVSNRQAFNNAGMGAVALLYEDEALLGHVLTGPHGFSFHVRESLLEDGIWYEGETYHFATLDHSLNLAEMARHRGIDLYGGGAGHGSLRAMFDGPLKVMLPDLTFPSRKDSWYGRGIGYHKDIYELGFARYGDPRYGGLLAHAYAGGVDRREVSWRSFLYLDPELPHVPEAELRSYVCEPMPGTGVAVLRRDQGQVYASLEYGHYGGGHGHPDRLHLSLHADGVHWLLDPGTGWYHVPELGWYRSTLAHNTVSIDGHSQAPSEGKLTAIGVAGGFQAAQAMVDGAYPLTRLRRTLCLGEGFLLDVFDVDATAEQEVDLAFNVRGDIQHSGHVYPTREPLAAQGGYPFLQHITRVHSLSVDVTVEAEGSRLRVLQRPVDKLFKAEAIGVPLSEERTFHTIISRQQGSSLGFATTWIWGDLADKASLPSGDNAAVHLDGTVHRLLLDDSQGLAVFSEWYKGCFAIAWFARRAVNHEALMVYCDFPLKCAALHWSGHTLKVDLPEEFGRVCVTGEKLPLTVQVTGLPEGASWHHDGDCLTLFQKTPVAVWLEPSYGSVQLAAGLENELLFTVARYRSAADDSAGCDAVANDAAAALLANQPDIDLPRGWRLEQLDLLEERPPLQSWRALLRLPADAQQAEIGVCVSGRHISFSAEVVPPLAVTWSIDAEAGHPELVLKVREQVGRSSRVWGEVQAPWLARAAHTFVLELQACEEQQVRLPLPRMPAPPTAPEPSERLDHAGQVLPGRSENEGQYAVAALLRIEGFSGLSRESFPLAWCLKRDAYAQNLMLHENWNSHEDAHSRLARWDHDARQTPLSGLSGLVAGRPHLYSGALTLDRPEQVYWSEEPWGGLADASATALLTWDEAGLHLECEVRDDKHISDANGEDLYENDSVQLYLDFRPPAHQNSNFAPGVIGFIFAPDAEKVSVKVEPIAGSRELANRGLAATWFTVEGIKTRVEASSAGYILQVFMPYRSLGIKPLQDGDLFRADLSLSDNDGSWYRRSQLVWSGARGDRRCYLRWAYLDPTGYGYVLVVNPNQERPA